MKKVFAFTLVVLIVFSGCTKKSQIVSPSSTPSPQPQQPSSSSEAPKSSASSSNPEVATKKLLDDIKTLDKDQVLALVSQYLNVKTIPDEYFELLKPIMDRVTYKIGDTNIDGDKANVEVVVTAVDAQSAINNVLPGAVTHLAAMQLTGKNIQRPDMVIAEYVRKNVDWSQQPTIKTETKLYLIRDAGGKWVADDTNPENLKFADAISGGAVGIATKMQELVERCK